MISFYIKAMAFLEHWPLGIQYVWLQRRDALSGIQSVEEGNVCFENPPLAHHTEAT